MKPRMIKSAIAATASILALSTMMSAPGALAGETQSKTVEKDVEVVVKDKMKKVIKINTSEDGKSVKKHYEILTEDGETKAYSYDEAGNKTEVEMKEIEGLEMDGMDIDIDGGNMKVFKLKDGGEWHSKDGKKVMKKRIMIDEDGEKVTIMGEGDGAMDMDHNVFIHKGDHDGEQSRQPVD